MLHNDGGDSGLLIWCPARQAAYYSSCGAIQLCSDLSFHRSNLQNRPNSRMKFIKNSAIVWAVSYLLAATYYKKTGTAIQPPAICSQRRIPNSRETEGVNLGLGTSIPSSQSLGSARTWPCFVFPLRLRIMLKSSISVNSRG